MYISNNSEETTCYTFEVKMVVQIFADSIEAASDKLDKEGGHVSSRKVRLLDTNSVYHDEDLSTESSETI